MAELIVEAIELQEKLKGKISLVEAMNFCLEYQKMIILDQLSSSVEEFIEKNEA